MGALIGGIIAVIIGILGIVNWWELFVKGLKAAVPFFILLVGVIAIAAGISDIKDRIEERKEKEKQEAEKTQQAEQK
ncbi:MAG: hypothetical protein NC906_02705 [Candidatus Omnitrophica bacterium]|nr:hypothetical protein [Candidatus Omnitrophota bacterium]